MYSHPYLHQFVYMISWRMLYFCVLLFLKTILTKLKSGKKSSSSENQCFHLAGCWNTILVPEIDKVLYLTKRFGTTYSHYYLPRDYMYLCKINISYVRNMPEMRYEVKQANWIWREALKNLKSSQNRTHLAFSVCEGDERDGLDSPYLLNLCKLGHIPRNNISNTIVCIWATV